MRCPAHMLLFYLLVRATTLLYLTPHFSVAKKWEVRGVGGGGALNSPVITKEGYWVVGSDLGGLYLSKNKGVKWVAIGSNKGLDATHVASMAAHPRRLIVGTDDGMFIGDTDGNNFARPSGPSIVNSGYFSACVVSSGKTAVVYATRHPQYNAKQPQILRSSDGGLSWKRMDATGLPDMRVVGMRTHPVDKNGVWVITGEGRFAQSPGRAYFSANGGKSFNRMDPGVGEVIDLAYSFNPNNLNDLYLTVKLTNGKGGGKLFFSESSGFPPNPWQEVKQTSAQNGKVGIPGIILTDETNHRHVRVIDLNYAIPPTRSTWLWETFNRGNSWTRTETDVIGGWSNADEDWGMGGSFQGDLHVIGYRADVPKQILWVNTQFVFKSTNGGKTFKDAVSIDRSGGKTSTRGLDNVVPVVIEPSKADKKLIYAGYLDVGIFRSDNGGTSWKSLNPGYELSHSWIGNGGNTVTVLADPDRPNVVWAQVAGDLSSRENNPLEPVHLVKSTNRGDTWTELTSGLPSNSLTLESLALVPSSKRRNRRLFVIADFDVYRSNNDGSSWERVLNCPDCLGVRHTASAMFAFGPSGVWRSAGQSGGQWNKLTLPRQMHLDWTKNLHWQKEPYTYIGPVELTSRGASELWLAVLGGGGGGAWYSSNSGSSWTKVFDNPYVRAVAVDPKTNQVLVGSSSAWHAGGLSSDSTGVSIHRNGRKKTGWKKLNGGLAYPFATFVKVTDSGDRWIISPGQGLMKWV